MYFPPFDGAALLVNGRPMPVESLEVDSGRAFTRTAPNGWLHVWIIHVSNYTEGVLPGI